MGERRWGSGLQGNGDWRGCGRRGGDVLDVVVEGVAGFFPSVEASAQGADAEDTQLVELEGNFRAGLFAGAGAVEDDVAVARDDFVVELEFVGADTHGAGEDAGVGEVVERVAEIDDEGWGVSLFGGVVEHGFELGWFEPEGANLGEEVTLFDDAVGDEAEDEEDKEESGEVGEEMKEGGAFLSEIAEEASGEEVGFGPDDGAGEIPEEEAGEGHAGLSGDGCGDGGEAGDELGEEQSDRAAAGEVALGFGDAGGGLERESAEEAEDAATVSAAEEVPDAIGDGAGGEDSKHGCGGTDAMRGAEGSGGEEDGDAGDGDAKLLDQHPDEEDDVGVLDEEDNGNRHGENQYCRC